MWRVTDRITDAVREYDTLYDMRVGELAEYAASKEACEVVRALVDKLNSGEDATGDLAYLGIDVTDLGFVMYEVWADGVWFGTHKKKGAAIHQFDGLVQSGLHGHVELDVGYQYGDETEMVMTWEESEDA